MSGAASLGWARAKHEPFAPDESWASLGCAGLASGEEDDIECSKDETETNGDPQW